MLQTFAESRSFSESYNMMSLHEPL